MKIYSWITCVGYKLYIIYIIWKINMGDVRFSHRLSTRTTCHNNVHILCKRIYNRRYEGMKVWRYDGMTVWLYDGMTVWRYDGMTVWWYDGMTVWRYAGMTVWRYDGMTVYRYITIGCIGIGPGWKCSMNIRTVTVDKTEGCLLV